MTYTMVDLILILANPIIIIAQAILYSRAMKSYSKLLETSFQNRWEILREHFEYRNEVERERMNQLNHPKI
jgi:hypothetical protein